MSQLGTVYRYFRVDADHDISADTLTISLDGITWSAPLTYTLPVNYPLAVAASNSSKLPKTGFTPYWWRALTGPANFQLATGSNTVLGLLVDTSEQIRMSWTVTVKDGE